MSIDNHKHNRSLSIAVTAFLALIAGFASGVYGAYAITEYVPRADAQAMIVSDAGRKLTLPVPTVAIAAVKKLPAPPKVTAADKKSLTPKSKNTMVVPRMGVNSAILEGNEKTLNKGIWHVPGTSNPAKGGNMVISAHRYMWRPPSTKTFWDIDKMKVGDKITITWEGKTYTYKVAKTYIVKPEKVDILANTKKPRLTLFSCTPKFTSKNRFVVEAYPVET